MPVTNSVVLANSNGSVGIGTISPTRKLDVNGTSIFRDFTTVVASNGNAVSNITWLSTDSGIMNIYTGNTSTVQLNSNGISYFNGGNLGIGTTSPTLAKLQVQGNVWATSFTGSFSGSITSPGSNTQIIYNNAGVLAGSNNFVFNGANVGIGTTNPAYPLHVIGNAYADGVISTTFWTNNSIRKSAPADSMNFRNSAGSIEMILDANGNLGIGTTAPIGKLQIGGTSGNLLTVGTLTNNWAGEVAIGVTNGNGVIISKVNTANDTNRVLVFYRNDTDGATIWGYTPAGGSGNVGFQIRANASSYFNGGNVGIGTTAPAYKLDVIGTSALSGDVYTGGELGIQFGWTGSVINDTRIGRIRPISNPDVNPYAGGLALDVYRYSGTQYQFYESVRFKADGNVGIGTTTPAYKLDVSGSGRFTSNVLLGTGTTGATSTPAYIDLGNSYSNAATRDKLKIYLYNSLTEQYGFSIGSNGDVQYHSNIFHDFYIANTLSLRINSTGNVGVGTSSPTLARLQVNGNVWATSFTGSFSGSISSPGSNTQVIYNNSGVLAGSNNFIFNGTSVGIGTVSPGEKLHVYSTETQDGIRVDATTYPELVLLKGGTIKGYISIAGNAGGYGTGTLADSLILRAESGYIHLANSANPVLTVNGNSVGIGTTTPALPFHVYSGADVARFQSNTNLYAWIQIKAGTTGDSWQLGSYNGGLNFYNDNNSSYRVFFKNDGNVGINTTSPAVALHVIANASGNGVIRLQNSNAAGYSNVQFYDSAATFAGSFGWINGTYSAGGFAGTNLWDAGDASKYFLIRGSTLTKQQDTNGQNGIFLLNQNTGTSAYSVIRFGQSGDDPMTGGGRAYIHYFNTTWNASGAGYWDPGSLATGTSAGNINFFVGGNNQFKIWTNSSQRFTVTGDGNVGIGTSSPAYKFHVESPSSTVIATIRSTDNSADGYSQLEFKAGTRFGYIWLANQNATSWGGDGSLNIYAGTGALTFYAGATQRVTMAANGAVRFNTYGAGAFTGVAAYNLAVDSSGNIIETSGGVVDGSGSPNYVSKWQDANTLTDSIIYDNGTNIGIGSASPTATLTISKAALNYMFDLENASEAAFKLRTYNSGSANGSATPAFIYGLHYSTIENATIRFYRGGSSVGGFLTFTTNEGTERMRITADGNVGIGSTSPAYKLDVTGDIRASQTVYSGGNFQMLGAWSNSPFTNSSWIRAASGAGMFLVNNGITRWAGFKSNDDFDINGGAFFVSSSNGNIGIGTVSPTNKVHVYGGRIALDNIATNQSALQFSSAGTEVAVLYRPASSNDIRLYNPTGGDLMTWSGTNVGIGTTSPVQKLQVNGSIALNTVTNGTSRYYTYPDANHAWYYDDDIVGSSADVMTYYQNFLIRYQDATNVFLINGNGNVGIGTISPAYKLDVSVAATAGMMLRGTGDLRYHVFSTSLTDWVGYELRSSNLDVFAGGIFRNNTSNNRVSLYNKSTEAISLMDTGNVGIGTTNPALATLQVNGNVYATSFTGSFSGTFAAPGSNTQVIYNSGGAFAASSNFVFNGTNVGIGIASPTVKLHVKGTGLYEGIVVDNGSTTGGGYYIVRQNGSTVGGVYVAGAWLGSTDSNLAIGAETGKTINFYTNGSATNRMIIATDGNVGIGTTSPNYRLTIANSAGNSAVHIGGGNSNTIPAISMQSDFVAWASSTNGFAYYYNATNGNLDLYRKDNSATENQVMTWVRASGNVGIGTTVPSFKLDINGTTRIVNTLRIDGFDTVGSQRAIGFGGNALNTNPTIYSNGGYLVITTATGQPLYLNSDSNGSILMNGTGNVGIGTITPAYKLDISTVQSIRVRGSSTGYTQGSIIFQSSTTDTPEARGLGVYAFNEGTDATWFYGTAYNAADSFVVNRKSGTTFQDAAASVGESSTFLLINSSGNVGINVTSPTAKLQIDSNNTPTLSGVNPTGAIAIKSTATTALTFGVYEFSPFYGWLQMRHGSLADIAYPLSLQPVGGNVGIGTTNPTAYLDVKGVQDTPGAISIQLRSGNSNATFSSNQITFGYNNTDEYRHAIKTRHNSGAGGGNAIDIYNWYQGIDGAATIGTQHVMTLDSGNVGIGTTSPGSKLHVYGGSLAAGGSGLMAASLLTTGRTGTYDASSLASIHTYLDASTIEMAAGSTNGWVSGISVTGNNATLNAGTVRLITTSGERLRVNSNGNIGINETSPTGKLTISNDSLGADGNIWQRWRYVPGNDSYRLDLKQTVTSGVVRYNFSMVNNGTGYNNVLVLDRGNVGIGTTDPAQKLEVQGDGVRLRLSTATGPSVYYFDIESRYDSANTLNFYAAGGVNILRWISNTNALSLQPSSGNVGIGTTDPVCKLQIANNVSAGGFASFDNYQILLYKSGTVATSYGMGIESETFMFNSDVNYKFYVDNVAKVAINSSGTITAAGDLIAYGSPSDATLKTNVKPLAEALEKITKLQGVSFTWKDSEHTKMTGLKDDIGFIAQEVQEILPELVRENDNGLLSLRDKGIVPYLVEAIKEQQKQIDELRYLLQNK